MKTQHLKLSRALLLSALAVGTAAPSAHAQFGSISEQEEIQAGRQSAAQAIKEYGRPLPANDPRQRRVARLGAMFAAQSKRRNIPYSYTVLQNDTVLNAFAAPGGPIFVTTKLVSTAANDAELAYVLGHETGHIENKHIVKAVEKQQKVGLVAGILGSILSRGKAGSVIGTATNVTYTLWARGFSRDQENDSDTYGVRAMARLGFDPRAAVSMLGKLGGNTSGLGKYLATHPSPDSRQDRVSNLIRQEGLLNIAQNAGGARLSLSGEESVYRPASSYTQYRDNDGTSQYPNNRHTGASGTIQLGAPLALVNSRGYRVVLAPVASLANYAGGSARAESNDTVIVGRGNDYLRIQLNSTQAILNGKRVNLSAAPRVIEGRLYAPLGTLAAGLGGSATYDSSRNAVRLTFDERSGILPLS